MVKLESQNFSKSRWDTTMWRSAVTSSTLCQAIFNDVQ